MLLISWSNFRFTKQDIIHFRYIFRLSDTMAILDCHVVSLVEAICIVLRCLTYPFRHGDVFPSLAHLCLTFHSHLIKCHFFLFQAFFYLFSFLLMLDFLQKTLLMLQMLFIVKGVHLTFAEVQLMIL